MDLDEEKEHLYLSGCFQCVRTNTTWFLYRSTWRNRSIITQKTLYMVCLYVLST